VYVSVFVCLCICSVVWCVYVCGVCVCVCSVEREECMCVYM